MASELQKLVKKWLFRGIFYPFWPKTHFFIYFKNFLRKYENI